MFDACSVKTHSQAYMSEADAVLAFVALPLLHQRVGGLATYTLTHGHECRNNGLNASS